MEQSQENTELNIWHRLYDDLDDEFDKKCLENGYLKNKLRIALAELSVYHRRFGRLSLQEEIDTVLGKMPAMVVSFPDNRETIQSS